MLLLLLLILLPLHAPLPPPALTLITLPPPAPASMLLLLLYAPPLDPAPTPITGHSSLSCSFSWCMLPQRFLLLLTVYPLLPLQIHLP